MKHLTRVYDIRNSLQGNHHLAPSKVPMSQTTKVVLPSYYCTIVLARLLYNLTMHLCAISITGRGKVKLRPSTLSKLEKNQNSRDHSSMNKKTENPGNATDIDRNNKH